MRSSASIVVAGAPAPEYLGAVSRLRETLDFLIASFAEDVVTALRNVPLSELLALSANGDSRSTVAPKRRGSPASATPRRPSKSEPSPRPSKSAPRHPSKRAPPGRVEPLAVERAERFFVERGTRGATQAQMRDVFEAQGQALPEDDGALVRLHVERQIIRNAGIRRATKNGLAPVFVHASLAG